MSFDPTRLQAIQGQFVSDMAAAMSGVMVNLGHKLGLYRAMAHAGPMSSATLAERTGTRERYVREWLGNQAAGGYVVYDAATRMYELPDEHAAVLAEADSPTFMAPGFDVVATLWLDESRVAEAFRTGEGIGWHEHSACLFSGTESFFRPGYKANLVQHWIPALRGMADRLARGARVADIGCGHGASTILMAQAYPASRFVGFDYHPESIETAQQRAREAEVEDRVRFEVARADDFSGDGYDLVCFMDCFHDLGDPLGAAVHTHRALADDGAVMLVEPFAGDRVEENFNPVGRLFYAASTALCTPNSLSQPVGAALGAQAGQQQLQTILQDAGFSRVRRATATPFNLILEARR